MNSESVRNEINRGKNVKGSGTEIVVVHLEGSGGV